ncbi:hypothetical protein [Bacteroides heparinolyticus]|uniref:hypothetical protein n=1 Tax=Prevotella heparinolytica TaxID=28113 RepID=UPI0035A1BA05
MEGLSWFKHRFNLSRDSRLYKLIDEEGARGYGSYLYIIEQLYNQECPRLFLGQLKLLQQKGFPQAYLEKIVRNYGLFIIEGDMFFSAIDYFGTSRKNREVSKKNTAGRRAKEEELSTDGETVDEETMSAAEEACLMTGETESVVEEVPSLTEKVLPVAEEVPPMSEEARSAVEEKGDFQAAASLAATAAEVPKPCMETPHGPAGNCLSTPSELPAGSQSASNSKSAQIEPNYQFISKLRGVLSLARVREEKKREEEIRKYLPHISPSFKVEEVEEQPFVPP